MGRRAKPANDNDPKVAEAPPIDVTPKQARELQRMRLLAAELFELAERLEQDLFTADVRRRVLAQKVPSPATVARVAELMRKKGM